MVLKIDTGIIVGLKIILAFFLSPASWLLCSLSHKCTLFLSEDCSSYSPHFPFHWFSSSTNIQTCFYPAQKFLIAQAPAEGDSSGTPVVKRWRELSSCKTYSKEDLCGLPSLTSGPASPFPKTFSRNFLTAICSLTPVDKQRPARGGGTEPGRLERGRRDQTSSPSSCQEDKAHCSLQPCPCLPPARSACSNKCTLFTWLSGRKRIKKEVES